MARFYGPGIFYYPAWALQALYKSISLIRAQENIHLANATRTAYWMNQSAYQRQVDRWRREARPISEDDEPEIATINPAAEEWFKKNDIPYRLAGE